MKAVFTFFYTVIIALVVSSCGGENTFTGGGCNPPETTTVIDSFSIVGSTTDGGIEVVNSSADFTLSWDLTSSCTYTYEVFLAVGDTQDPLDISVASGSCGLGQGCSENVDITCSFNATNKTIACDGGTAEDVSSLLPDPSPLNRYFILEASNQMSDSDVMATNQLRVDF